MPRSTAPPWTARSSPAASFPASKGSRCPDRLRTRSTTSSMRSWVVNRCPHAEALPPAPDGRTIVGRARVDDLVVVDHGSTDSARHDSTRRHAIVRADRVRDRVSAATGSSRPRPAARPARGRNLVDDGARVVARRQPLRDRPERVAGPHDDRSHGGRRGLGRAAVRQCAGRECGGRAALGGCEG